ncbi:hypothetical protein [Burkholderia sp. D-99]|uniref:hypothetical protein n=1 Tax=unclassified Burkholderia TaxID=2613784 RepID=UPI00387E8373
MIENHLPAALPAEDLAHVSKQLALVDMPLGKVLYESDGANSRMQLVSLDRSTTLPMAPAQPRSPAIE